MAQSNETLSTEIHNCVDSECKGSSLGGNKFICALCKQPMFVNCLNDRPEIICLLSLLAPPGKKSNNVTSTEIINLNNAISTMFSSESTFNFVCLECKTRGSFQDIEADYERKIIAIRTQVQQLKIEYESKQKQNETSIETLKEQLRESSARIEQLQTSQSNDSTEHSQTHSRKSAVSDNFIDSVKSIELLISDMIENSKAQTVNCETMATAISQLHLQLNKNSSSHDSNTDVNVTNKGAPTDLNESQDELPTNGASSLSQGVGLKSPNFASNLKPPVRESNDVNTNSSGDNALAIYVSKFHPKTTCDDITNHIIGKTKLTGDDFSVTLMTKERILKSEFLTFVSFKITSTTAPARTKILNENLWAPDFKAEPFNQKSSRVSDKNSAETQKRKQQIQPPRNVSGKTEQNLRKNGGIVNVKEKNSASKGVNNKKKQKSKQQQQQQQQNDGTKPPTVPPSIDSSKMGYPYPQGFCYVPYQHQFSPHYYQPQMQWQQQQQWSHQPQQPQNFGLNQPKTNTAPHNMQWHPQQQQYQS